MKLFRVAGWLVGCNTLRLKPAPALLSLAKTLINKYRSQTKVRDLKMFDETKVFSKSSQAEHFRPWSCLSSVVLCLGCCQVEFVKVTRLA